MALAFEKNPKRDEEKVKRAKLLRLKQEFKDATTQAQFKTVVGKLFKVLFEREFDDI